MDWYRILGWYSLVVTILGAICAIIGDKSPGERFLIFIFQLPLIYFVYMAMFGAIK